MRRSLRRTFFRPERPTLTSRSLQSITRPFQKRFREVFGNNRILIFYLSIKAWEEKSFPKSLLGWFFLVFGEGKATKEDMSIFWFIWPLTRKGASESEHDLRSRMNNLSVKKKNRKNSALTGNRTLTFAMSGCNVLSPELIKPIGE